MKLIVTNSKILSLSILLSCISLLTVAQDKKVDVDISVGKDQSQWYMSPVAWVLGGAIFIIIIVALLRGNNNK